MTELELGRRIEVLEQFAEVAHPPLGRIAASEHDGVMALPAYGDIMADVRLAKAQRRRKRPVRTSVDEAIDLLLRVRHAETANGERKTGAGRQ